MNAEEKLENLERMIYEVDMLISALHEILLANEEKQGISKMCYLCEVICQKFPEIRAIF